MNLTTASIRGYREDDKAELSRLIVRTITESNAKDYSELQIAAFVSEYTPEKITTYAANRALYVATEDGAIVGTVSMDRHRDRSNCAILLSLFVDPKYQRRGIGRSLALHVERAAAKLPSDTIVVPSSLTAHAFYKKLGYVDDQPNVAEYPINIWMSKPLKPQSNLQDAAQRAHCR